MQVLIKPNYINVEPHKRFQFECISNITGATVSVLYNGQPIETDQRFIINKPKPEHAIVQVQRGLEKIGKHYFRFVIFNLIIAI